MPSPVALFNAITVPAGAGADYSLTLTGITKARSMHTSGGFYKQLYGSSLAGGVPNGGIQQYVVFPLKLNVQNPGSTATKFSPVVSPTNGMLGPWWIGSVQLKLIGTLLFGLSSGTPAVRIPGAIPLVQILE